MCAHFHLLWVCEQILNNGSLEGVDALLGKYLTTNTSPFHLLPFLVLSQVVPLYCASSTTLTRTRVSARMKLRHDNPLAGGRVEMSTQVLQDELHAAYRIADLLLSSTGEELINVLNFSNHTPFSMTVFLVQQ